MSTPTPPPGHPDPPPGLGLEGGLTDAQFRQIVHLVWALPGRWLVERNEDECGHVFALVIQDVEAGDGLAFSLFQAAHEINLDLCRGDGFEALGTFETVKQAMTQVLQIARRAGPGRH